MAQLTAANSVCDSTFRSRDSVCHQYRVPHARSFLSVSASCLSIVTGSVVEKGSCSVAQAGLEFMHSSCFNLLSVGITGMGHHAPLSSVFFYF